MDYIDYRTKLGVGFQDKELQNLFISRIQVFLQSHSDISFDRQQETDFCYAVGVECKLENQDFFDLEMFNKDPKGLQRLWLYLSHKDNDFASFLATLIMFYNTYNGLKKDKKEIEKAIKKAFIDSHIKYEIISDKDGIFFFPEGAKELDGALVSEPLEWLKVYPESRKQFVIALVKYNEANNENASDVADAFRKALEQFFKEYFNEDKSIENMISIYGGYLKSKGVPKEISNDFEKLLKLFTDFNNSYAKHNNRTRLNVLEYIMYQTGNIIRLLCTLQKN